MYKITLFDYNCPSCVSGVAEFFTDDINDFQKRWFKLEPDKGRKQRFLDSKKGDIVVDYFSNDSNLNIVQEDKNTTILKEQSFELLNKDFVVYNAYNCPGEYYADKINLTFRWVKFNNKFYRLADYKIEGICEKSLLYEDYGYEDVDCWGNNIIENHIVVERKPKSKGNKEDFKENWLQTICYVPSKIFNNQKEIEHDIKSFKITDEVLNYIFRDIIGEAG